MNTFKTKLGTELPISNLRGKDYLEVKYRLVWFREERPDWAIETQLVEMSDKHCVARAVIKDKEGRIISTGHKHEDKQGFADYREKSETGAIGRALAHVGYGTQFAPELDEQERVVDSPVERRNLSVIQNSSLEDELEGPEYVIAFGKFRGKKIKDIPLNELKDYCSYISEQANFQNRPVSGLALKFMNNAEIIMSLSTKPK